MIRWWSLAWYYWALNYVDKTVQNYLKKKNPDANLLDLSRPAFKFQPSLARSHIPFRSPSPPTILHEDVFIVCCFQQYVMMWFIRYSAKYF